MIGVSFQPGSNQFGQQNGNAQPSAGSGVQEAIKILSLRLPRVLGAQGATPMPLLTSQGSGGNPRVDQIVNQVLSRVMPGKTSASSGGPSFAGTQNYLPSPDVQAPSSPWSPHGGTTPRVIIGNPPWWGTDADLQPPGTRGTPPGLIAPLPPNFQLPAPSQPPQDPGFGDIGKRLGEYPSYGGNDSPFEQPLF